MLPKSKIKPQIDFGKLPIDHKRVNYNINCGHDPGNKRQEKPSKEKLRARFSPSLPKSKKTNNDERSKKSVEIPNSGNIMGMIPTTLKKEELWRKDSQVVLRKNRSDFNRSIGNELAKAKGKSVSPFENAKPYSKLRKFR